MRRRYRLRRVVNLANGATLAGLGVAALGGARVRPGPDGLAIAEGYRLVVPPAPAFTLGNVILARSYGPLSAPLLAHEARHATQFAWCGGVLMIPLYLVCAGVSWLICGDFGAWNAFERRAGLADGGYKPRPPRWSPGRN